MYFNRQILEIATMKSKISLATTETELEQWDQVVYWLVITGKNSQMNKTKEKQWLFVWETIKISHETTGFARRGVPCYVVLFNTGNNSTRETKTKKCTYFNTYQELLITKITRETAARPGRWLYYLTPATTREWTKRKKDEEVEEPRPYVESPLPFPYFLLYRKIVPKRTSKRPQSLEDGHWGRSLRSVPNTNDGFDCLPLRFPEFSCLKKMEWGKEGSRKQANKQCIVAFWQDFVQPRKWTGIFLSCWIHFYKVSFWNPQKTHMKCLFNRISRKCDHFIVKSRISGVLNFWFNFKENVQLNHSVFLELNFDLFNIC